MQAGECSPATAAMIGAALGALIADDRRGKGAAIGAGLGALACYIINTQSRQTEAGADVDGRYRADNQGALPAQPLPCRNGAFITSGIIWLIEQQRARAP
jgi:crotonobetainyl-CoA:carnitine CoA-transferase CaiB-like acyl-CoA transferase